MCGPSSAEKRLQDQMANFSTILQSNYTTLFGKQLDVLNAIGRSLSPILGAGPSQQGMSPAELAARNTQAINNAAAANRNAIQAARTYAAGQGGGGTSGVTTGIQQQIEGAIASSSANQLATAQNQITQENYQRGAANYWRAAGGMQELAGQLSPNAAQQGTISSGGQAFSEAHQINEEQNQKWQTIAGAVTGIGSQFLTGGLSNLGPGESFGEGIGDFFKGGISSLGAKG